VKGGQKTAFRRPVGDGEDNVFEHAVKIMSKGLAEIACGLMGIVGERGLTVWEQA
jgi:hypothetical protein